ncbi:MAG: hypothetical protein J5J06_02165 [Phycisphaerae bacterium]|nr:hypothetical protein [Phycisphaerae bacterium]
MRYLFGKLPFDGSIFWKVLVAVFALVAIAWFLVLRFTEYTMTGADYGGSFICSIIFAYWVHLWLLPMEHAEYDDEDEFGSESDERLNS